MLITCLTSAYLKAFCVRVVILSAEYGADSVWSLLDLTLILQLSALEERAQHLQTLLLCVWSVLAWVTVQYELPWLRKWLLGWPELGNGERLRRNKPRGAECP